MVVCGREGFGGTDVEAVDASRGEEGDEVDGDDDLVIQCEGNVPYVRINVTSS